MPAKLNPVDGVAEWIHGTCVADPYRWLEERQSSATEEWLAGQRARFHGYFEELGTLDGLRSRVREFVDVEATDQIGKVRDRYFYRRRRAGEQQPSIYMMHSQTRAERLLIDPSALGSYTSVGIFRISKDGNLLAYELKHGGEHSKAIHVVDVNSGRFLRDHLDTGLARGFEFREAGDGFYYCHEFLEKEASNPQRDHSVRFHRFGTLRAHDPVLLSLPRSVSSKLVVAAEDETLSAIFYHEYLDQLVVDFYVAMQDHHDSWNCIARNVPAPFSPFFCQRMLLGLWDDDAPHGKICELDRTNCHPQRVIVPEWDAPIKHFTIAQSRIFVSYVIGTETVVRVWSLKGDFLGTLPLERGYTWHVLPTYTYESDELFLSRESFSRPLTLYCLNADSCERTVWSERHAPASKSAITTRKVTFSTKDGAEITMSLVGAADASGLRPQPVIMTAYGGFGRTLTPQFSAFVSLMLEHGFLFALPEIRGGGEHGTGWHDAARGRNRQVAINDFIAAADWLCGEGVTSPEKLAVFGGSNSGLLVGAAITQRPDLFRAALCIAPLLDMVRYHFFDRARIWSREYGTADDPDDFRALYAYSPYHHVLEDRNYPAVLLVSGDKDTRCNPAHARKMTARLQDRSAQTSSVLLDYGFERGHAATMPLLDRIDALTHRIAFLCHELGVAMHHKHSPAGLVAQAWFCLLRTEWHLRRYKDRPLQSVLQQCDTNGESVGYSPQQICHAMDIACVLYFKVVLCLQRSVALTMLLRRYGFTADLVIGARIVPAKFHAWVEMNRIVLNDRPYVPRLYRELERC
jgi:prolyl oligopeptidase